MQLITAMYNYQQQHYWLEQLPSAKDRERWKVIGKNGFLILSNNRPLIIRKKLKHWKPEWQQEGTEMTNKAFIKALCEAIDQVTGISR